MDTGIFRGHAPIQIQAEILRRRQSSLIPFAGRDFAMMPDYTAADPEDCDPQPGRHWRDEDLQRAITVARESGMSSYRIEIAPDGTISIVVGAPAQDAGSPGSDDEPAVP